MQEVIYKQKDGMVFDFKQDEIPKTFNGYKITKDYQRLSSIIEYEYGKQLGQINFRPTKTPVIFSVNYGTYHEDRYNNGKVSSVYSTDHLCSIYGEVRRYDTCGNLTNIKFYNDTKDITNEIKSFIGFTGDDKDFINYQFREEDVFNIFMRYGNKFKFHNEYRWDSSYFDRVASFCIK